MKSVTIFWFILFTLIFCSCTSTDGITSEKGPDWYPDSLFGSYWYQGVAEVSSYDVVQQRYGQLHQGEAVVIFVTEDFSRDKLVKLSDPIRVAEKDKMNVMKFNRTTTYNTGIYQYNTMESSFKPVQVFRDPHAVKVTTSSMEWCGQFLTVTELNEGEYTISQNSYFEGETDKITTLEGVWLEDEIWQTIRFDPELLPTGELRIIPSLLLTELRHKDFELKTATATMDVVDSLENTIKYKLTYDDRSMTILFSDRFPYQILGWEERYQGLVSTAELKEQIMTDYWRKNRNKHEYLRDSLKLVY